MYRILGILISGFGVRIASAIAALYVAYVASQAATEMLAKVSLTL